MEPQDSVGGRFLDGVRDAEEAHRLGVGAHEHHRLTVLAQLLRTLGQRTGRDPEFVQELPVPEGHSSAAHQSLDASTGERLEALGTV